MSEAENQVVKHPSESTCMHKDTRNISQMKPHQIDDTTCIKDSKHQMNETTCLHKDTRSITWGRGVSQEAYRLPEGALKGSKDSNGPNEPKVEVQEGL